MAAAAPQSEAELKAILDKPVKAGLKVKEQDELLKEKEQAILKLGQIYRDANNAAELTNVVRSSRPLMEHLAKAKTAKLIRTLLDYFAAIPDTTATQIEVTTENIDWARKEKRIFLAQNLETRLVALYLDNNNQRDALKLITALLKELKKLDDKMVLTEVHLLESRANYALANMPKAKAALTSARTAANSIYCPPLLQAQLDLQSGVLHAEDKDYKTGFSYFFEALEGLSSQEDPKATSSLKYMLLCKIMLNLPEDVKSLVASKLAQKYAGKEVEAMKAVAAAHEERSLAKFEETLVTYKKELSDDPIIRNHLASLYDTLLEQNLIRVIEPYSRVEIEFVAEKVKLPKREVESKLSQMILDKSLRGVLDQGEGCLVVFEEPEEDKTYDLSIDTLGHIKEIVEHLFSQAQKLA